MSACETCKWWRLERAKDNPNGICRRYPQAIRKHSTSWCGEHQEKDTNA